MQFSVLTIELGFGVGTPHFAFSRTFSRRRLPSRDLCAEQRVLWSPSDEEGKQC